MFLLAIFTWQCKKDPLKGEVGTCPSILSTDPSSGDTNVVTSIKITAIFNEAMDAATVNETTFVLYQGANQVSGTVTYSGNTATFTPAGYLAINTYYTATVTTGTQDPYGNALPANYVWSFKTGVISIDNQPRVILTDPSNGSIGVAVNKKITADFNKVMDPLTINTMTFLLKQGSNQITGVVAYSGTTATFTPVTDLTSNTVYVGTITTGAKDTADNALANDYTWSFTTGTTLDTIRPTVTSTDPANGATLVILNKIITANFSKSMDPLTIDSTTYMLKQGLTKVPGLVSYSGNKVSYTPSSDLMPSTTYNVRVTTGAKDLAGNALANDYTWTFTTGTTAGQATVNLQSAGNFVVLSGSGITNTGLTIINGDIGTSPTGTINGFPPGTVNGTIHAADPVAAQAKLDLTSAYNNAQGRSTGAISLPGDLSGLTFTPGLYSNSTSVMLSAGNVTLDALGDVNAVFIFKMGSTLTTLSGTGVILSGGAQAKNIFWSVGTSATLGTNSVFYGNILADQSISLNTGAVLNGRALTRIAAVTMQSNIVNKP